ncbi:MAG: hypothetical protein NZ903_02770 [Candidatus Micrarchaeota archaeon]|nr:hypothetical protein [Candidatus Micrarchaeota archaeon]
MIRDNIKRVEEIRYLISKKIFDLMKLKHELPYSNKISELESEISLLRDELSNHLSAIQDAGYVYLLINKKEIESLKDQFKSLSEEERQNAFREIGRGYEILSKSNSILKKNYELRETIADLIISLPASENVVQTIKNYVEGYSNSGEFKLENGLAAGRISSLISSLGFSSTYEGDRVYLGDSISKIKKMNDEIITNIFPTEDSPSQPQKQSQKHSSQTVLNQDLSEIKEEIDEMEQVEPIPADQILSEGSTGLNDYGEIRKSISIKNENSDDQIKLRPEDLQVNLTYDEVCQKIEEIMNNYKMKRWVLGAFKDEEEKKQYEKIQSILIKLMRLKQSMEEKGEK